MAIPVYIADELENQTAKYYGIDLPDTYEVDIVGRKYRGKLENVYFCTEYYRNVCDYICEDDTIMRFVCGKNGLEFLSVEFGTPINTF